MSFLFLDCLVIKFSLLLVSCSAEPKKTVLHDNVLAICFV
uniref:Lipoprotein n=1 Tax=Anguilla anguilla TaxID=7936 RepID=A0A0E9UG54_ANGAN